MVRLSLITAVTAILGSALASECKSRTGLLQMVTYVKRHPDFSREEYWDYWQTQHAPKVAPLAVHFNITRYQQVRPSISLLASALLELTQPPSTGPSRRQDPPYRCRLRSPRLARARRL